MTISDVISNKILNIISSKNISINKLAHICNISQSTIEHLVNKQNKNPKLSTIIRICKGLNIPLKDFFDDNDFEKLKEQY